MNNWKERFDKEYICTWQSDPKLIALDEALDRYYKESGHVDSRTAREMWSQLRQYARDLGFTGQQFQEAKMRATGRIR